MRRATRDKRQSHCNNIIIHNHFTLLNFQIELLTLHICVSLVVQNLLHTSSDESDPTLERGARGRQRDALSSQVGQVLGEWRGVLVVRLDLVERRGRSFHTHCGCQCRDGRRTALEHCRTQAPTTQ